MDDYIKNDNSNKLNTKEHATRPQLVLLHQHLLCLVQLLFVRLGTTYVSRFLSALDLRLQFVRLITQLHHGTVDLAIFIGLQQPQPTYTSQLLLFTCCTFVYNTTKDTAEALMSTANLLSPVL